MWGCQTIVRNGDRLLRGSPGRRKNSRYPALPASPTTGCPGLILPVIQSAQENRQKSMPPATMTSLRVAGKAEALLFRHPAKNRQTSQTVAERRVSDWIKSSRHTAYREDVTAVVRMEFSAARLLMDGCRQLDFPVATAGQYLQPFGPRSLAALPTECRESRFPTECRKSRCPTECRENRCPTECRRECLGVRGDTPCLARVDSRSPSRFGCCQCISRNARSALSPTVVRR